MKKKLLVLALLVSAFASGYGVVADAYPFPWPYSRNEYRGYWEDRPDDAGKYVIAVGGGCTGAYNYWNGEDNCNAVPNWIDTAGEFTSFVIDKYNNGSSTDRVGAAFIILTMISENRTWPVSGGEIQQFIDEVNAAAPYTTWATTAYNYNLNSYNQRGNNNVGPNDIALYDHNASGHRTIIFRNSAGQVRYVIKTRCFNPVGFNGMTQLDPVVNFNMTGLPAVSNPTPAAGQTIRFDYNVTNNGPTATNPFSPWWAAVDTISGIQTIPGHDSGFYWVGRIDTLSENYPIPSNTPPGTRICRRIDIHPANQNWAGYSSPEVCATVQSVYTLTPVVTATVTSGGVPILGNVAEPGDSITFTYAVNNSGGISQSTNCTYRQATWPGNNQSAPVTAFTPAGANCPPARTFPALSSTQTASEVVPAATLNTTICRSFTVTPASNTNPAAAVPDQKCVFVAAKPYTRVWGGDVSAGNGLADTSGVCTTTTNNNGSIVGWNRRSNANPALTYSGTGVQFAAFALSRVTDFASALYDPGGAPEPSGLVFSNIGANVAAGNFGGGFGSAPCIPNYYATRPAAPQPIPATVAAMSSGVYGNNGTANVTLGGGGIVNPNNRITVYVNGNVYITGNITYSGSWNVASMPLFELIVSGNIYIDNDVTQLDGVYVAQASAVPNSGQIITCATGFSEMAVTSLYANCTRKLTVNGLFTANRIQLLRTIGTLSQSNTSEASTVPHIAEVFNYGPALWIKQPVRQSEVPTPEYDAIISLPPIL